MIELEKSSFLTDALHYSWHIIHLGELELATYISSAILYSKQLRSLTGFQSFFALGKGFRPFIPSLAHIADPPNKNLRT